MSVEPERQGHLSVAVVVVTYNRPDRVVDCLQHLGNQSVRPERIVVVDSSLNALTEQAVLADFPGVVYVRNPMGRGRTPESRQIGYSMAAEDIIAFLDDDANAYPDWLEQLLSRYSDASVGGVGGSALNGIDGERDLGLGSIGLLLPNGVLTGNFAADPGRDVEVDHLLGANMSFRRSAIAKVGGIFGDYPGTCMREESDIALRVKKAGLRLVYTPAAVVDHIPGTYAKGHRFDRRYVYFANRNSIVLFSRVYGERDRIVARFARSAVRDASAQARRGLGGIRRMPLSPLAGFRQLVGGFSNAAAIVMGLLAGFPAARVATKSDRERLRQLNIL